MFTLRPMRFARGTTRARRFAVTLAFGALVLCGLSTSNAYAQPGWVRQYTGQLVPPGVRPPGVPTCYGAYCQFWEPLDRNAYTARIAAGQGELYQLHYGGAIFKYPSTPCASGCPGWHLAGENDPAAKAIFAGGAGLYKMRQDGSVFVFTGSGAWSQVEGPDSARITIAVGEYRMASLYADGSITILGQRFPGDAVAIVLDGNDDLYRLSATGDIDVLRWRWSFNWVPLDKNPVTIAIAAAGSGQLYQLQDNGSIWRYTGRVCNPGCQETWERLNNNPATARIIASGDELYMWQNNGSLWRYTGMPCNSDVCSGWEVLMGDGVGRIAVDGNRLYALTQQVARSTRQRVCYECL